LISTYTLIVARMGRLSDSSFAANST
jgi:hypothetical protein